MEMTLGFHRLLAMKNHWTHSDGRHRRERFFGPGIFWNLLFCIISLEKSKP
jgi:hypothetical protein